VEWTDTAIVLGSRRHGEANAVVELMTRMHGRHIGLVRGGSAPRLASVLQAGNKVFATWRARLDEHLGYYALEALDLRAASLMSHGHALFGLQHLGMLCRLLPERDPHETVYDLLDATVGLLEAPAGAAIAVARFELHMLAELGFGLDLTACAATGQSAELVYVSPKSGRAVSRAAGEPWRDRLLRLPVFLSDGGDPAATEDDLRHGFELTGYFLARHVFEPRGEAIPEARHQFIAAAMRAAKLGRES